MPENWTVNAIGKHVCELNLRFADISTTRRILLLADLHWDNSKCRLDILKRTLDEAKEQDIPVFLFGDTFCAMQGKWDRRADQEQLRPEHRGNNYLDKLVDTATIWFAPYKDILALISRGNHETSITERHQTDLVDRLVGNLRHKGGYTIAGPYWGYVLVKIFVEASSKVVDTKRIFYHHGYGGGGEITRGLIDQSRTRSQYEADIFVSGHIHRRNFDENIVIACTRNGFIRQKQQLFLRCSSFKDESECSWHASKGRAARPIGGWWVEFSLEKSNRTQKNYQVRDIKPITAP